MDAFSLSFAVGIIFVAVIWNAKLRDKKQSLLDELRLKEEKEERSKRMDDNLARMAAVREAQYLREERAEHRRNLAMSQEGECK